MARQVKCSNFARGELQVLRYALFILLITSTIATAQETDASGTISLELNAVQSTDGACTLSFLIVNGLEQTIDRLVYETVLFDQEGQVDRLTLFDFGTLPPARPRVRQFAVPQMECAQLGRVLFNGANTCEGAGINSETCEAALTLSTRTEVEVLG